MKVVLAVGFSYSEVIGVIGDNVNEMEFMQAWLNNRRPTGQRPFQFKTYDFQGNENDGWIRGPSPRINEVVYEGKPYKRGKVK